MTNEQIIEAAAKNCRSALADCAAAFQNASQFYRDGDNEQYKIFRTTLVMIRDRSNDFLAQLDKLEEEFNPSEQDTAAEDALAMAEGRNCRVPDFNDF